MAYKIGDKFVIEIDSVMTNKKGTLYGIKGFKSLVFDDYGLEQLEKIPSKQDVIEYLVDNVSWFDEDGCEPDEDEKRYIIERLINGVSSSQPKQKVGKWIPCDVDSRGMTNMFVCSKCGSFTSLPILKYANAMEYDFCPNCGADMRGEQDE